MRKNYNISAISEETANIKYSRKYSRLIIGRKKAERKVDQTSSEFMVEIFRMLI